MNHTLSRREFLAAVAASAGLWGTETVQADTRAESLKRFGGFHFGIQAHGLRSFPVDEAIRIIHEDLQLHWVEFSKKHIGPDASSRGDPTRARAARSM